MATDNLIAFPGSALAYREYDAELSDGAIVSLAFTLGDSNADTGTARFAREHNALAFGLIFVRDLPGAPSGPIVWLVDGTHLSLATESDRPISEELRDLIELYLERYFIEITPIAPQFADLHTGPIPPANDNRTLH
jgi:hypothetical protein